MMYRIIQILSILLLFSWQIIAVPTFANPPPNWIAHSDSQSESASPPLENFSTDKLNQEVQKKFARSEKRKTILTAAGLFLLIVFTLLRFHLINTGNFILWFIALLIAAAVFTALSKVLDSSLFISVLMFSGICFLGLLKSLHLRDSDSNLSFGDFLDDFFDGDGDSDFDSGDGGDGGD